MIATIFRIITKDSLQEHIGDDAFGISTEAGNRRIFIECQKASK